MASAARQRQGWIVIGWQGITLEVPDDWYPAALGADRVTGYLRVQNAEGSVAEVKWFKPTGTVDMDKEMEKYRRTLEKAARKRRQTVDWKPKPKVSVRESKPDKNRRFFGWSADTTSLGSIWYCRTCGRVVIAQVTTPAGQDANALASSVLSSLEDHGEDGTELWSLYGLQVRIPEKWVLDKHQLMAGYTMLQFADKDRALRAERWALANVALKDATLDEFMEEKSRKFWKDYRLSPTRSEWLGHQGVLYAGRTRRIWRMVQAPVMRLLRRPISDAMSVRAWHCDVENKVFAVHAVHPRGDTALFEATVESLQCHTAGSVNESKPKPGGTKQAPGRERAAAHRGDGGAPGTDD